MALVCHIGQQMWNISAVTGNATGWHYCRFADPEFHSPALRYLDLQNRHLCSLTKSEKVKVTKANV